MPCPPVRISADSSLLDSSYLLLCVCVLERIDILELNSITNEERQNFPEFFHDNILNQTPENYIKLKSLIKHYWYDMGIKVWYLFSLKRSH